MARGMFDRSLVADDMLESGGVRVPRGKVLVGLVSGTDKNKSCDLSANAELRR